MPVFYLEPSALVKYYVSEPGSAWVRDLVDTRDDALITAEVTIVEVSAALAMAARMHRIARQHVEECWAHFKGNLLGRCHLLPTRRSIVDDAAQLCRRNPLRGFDAVHLASGLRVRANLAGREELRFVTSDAALVAAARAEQLTVDDPTAHPEG